MRYTLIKHALPTNDSTRYIQTINWHKSTTLKFRFLVWTFFTIYGILVPHEEKKLSILVSHPSLPFSPLPPPSPPPCGAELCDEHGQDEYFFGTKITQKIWWIHFCNLNHILYWGRSNFQAQKIMSTTRVSLVGDHCLYSLNVWFRGDIVRRN